MILLTRVLTFTGGSVVVVPLMDCESQEEAQRIASKDAAQFASLMEAALILPNGHPSGMTAKSFFRGLGLTGVSYGHQQVPKASPIVLPERRLILDG